MSNRFEKDYAHLQNAMEALQRVDLRHWRYSPIKDFVIEARNATADAINHLIEEEEALLNPGEAPAEARAS
jgi:hypothetical protein